MAVDLVEDRFGVGWRPELAAGIFAHLEHIDVVEVIADDLIAAPRRRLLAMQTLAAQVPVVLHGVSLGLASTAMVDRSRLDRLARVVDAVRPHFWSEHLAFVRSEGREIGHLAAPPRNDATIEGAARNIERTAAVVGSRPLVENIATLIDPPGSTHDEVGWISHILAAAHGELLLDLHNLYANAVNFGREPGELLSRIPFERVRAVHLAGGKWIASSTGQRRLLDDHLHDVPSAVYRLLAEVAARAPHPLTVILERDGAFPPFERLAMELDRAREAVAAGRQSAAERIVNGAPPSVCLAHASAEEAQLEAFLARLYVDARVRARFLSDPRGEAERAGLSPVVCDALIDLDRVGLELAAQSFEWKRSRQGRTRSFPWLRFSRAPKASGPTGAE